MNLTLITFLVLTGIVFIACWGKKDSKLRKADGMEDLTKSFRKNRDTVWFREEILDVDAPSFEVIDDYFVKDKTHVFFYKTYRLSQDYFTTKRQKIQKLNSADPTTFTSLGYGYAKDKSNAWYLGDSFKVMDLNSLRVLNHNFVKDDKAVYVDRKPMAGSDGKTFELMTERYAKDSKKYYYCSPSDGRYSIQPIQCHYPSFEVIDYQFCKDNSSIYYEGSKLSEAKSSTFELTSHGYSKDNQHVYFRNKKVDQADPKTFTTFVENENSLGETVYAKDKNFVYMNELSFSNFDVTTFRILNEKYVQDKNGIYYKMKKVEKADVGSFRVFPYVVGDADAEDKNHRFGEGRIVE